MSELKSLSLNNIGEGGAVEQFDIELAKVLANINDENTKPDAIREVNLKIKIKPSEERDNFSYLVEVKSKMAPVKGFAGLAFVRKDQGVLKAYEPNEKQMHFEDLTENKKMEVISNG